MTNRLINEFAIPPILTAYIFILNESETLASDLESVCARLREFDIDYVIQNESTQPPKERLHEPIVMVSVGGRDLDFSFLCALPLSQRRRWLHVAECSQINPKALIHCWLSATDPLSSRHIDNVPKVKLPIRPLVSVFTAAYRSGEKLKRPHHSLLGQTYSNWEWVIVDDSGDDCATFRNYIATIEDKRVVKVLLSEHIGRIGSVKRIAAGISSGQILLELDHDDQLMPDALQRLVDAFLANPDAGFVFGECAEIYEETGISHWYGWDAGFGYSTYWRQWDSIGQRVVDVQRTPDTNSRTIRHLVGLPNHPRAWTREFYNAIGGYRIGLSVSDDYDLLVRSFLVGRFVRVPHLLYRQYRNAGGGNTTFKRNSQIQRLCHALEQFYRERIDRRLIELKMPDTHLLPYRRIWSCADSDSRWMSAVICHLDKKDPDSRLFVLTYDDKYGEIAFEKAVQNALKDGWKNLSFVVVGNVSEENLMQIASLAPAGALRWWRMERTWPVSDMVRYGRLLCTSVPVAIYGVNEEIINFESDFGRPSLKNVNNFILSLPRDRGFDRMHILNELKQRFDLNAYLEISADVNEVYKKMNGFNIKIGINSSQIGPHPIAADKFFKANQKLNKEDRANFDLIYIGDVHDHQVAMNLIESAIECLLPNGAIVVHNCFPFDSSQQTVPQKEFNSTWIGDVWKAIFKLRTRRDLDVAVGQFDWGVAVIRIRKNSSPLILPKGEMDWDYFLRNHALFLNIKEYDQLIDWINNED